VELIASILRDVLLINIVERRLFEKPVIFTSRYDVTSQKKFTADDGLLARIQYSEVPATGYLDTDFS